MADKLGIVFITKTSSRSSISSGVNYRAARPERDRPREWLLKIEGMSFAINRSVDGSLIQPVGSGTKRRWSVERTWIHRPGRGWSHPTTPKRRAFCFAPRKSGSIPMLCIDRTTAQMSWQSIAHVVSLTRSRVVHYNFRFKAGVAESLPTAQSYPRRFVMRLSTNRLIREFILPTPNNHHFG